MRPPATSSPVQVWPRWSWTPSARRYFVHGSILGLTLLLFVIGLEVNLRSLLASGRTLIVTGLLQVPVTLAVGFGIFLLVGMTGWTLLGGIYPALYLGVACAFSSTLLVVKYLQAKRRLDSTA